MKTSKKMSHPVLVNLSEDLKSWYTLLNIKSQSPERENKRKIIEPKGNTIQITFLKKMED